MEADMREDDVRGSSTQFTSSASHQLVMERFGLQSMADKYPSEYSDRWRDRREKKCILECLKSIPCGARVLDLPCGTGRLTRILVEHGYQVTAADVSEAMLHRARDHYRSYREQGRGATSIVEFALSDILDTKFDDDAFDGVTCIRLFHHFAEAETRRKAFQELRRICRGPIVVSFLNSFALDPIASRFKAWVRGKRQVSQLPISFTTFAADIEAAGLKIDKRIAAHWGVSSRWFLVLSHRES